MPINDTCIYFIIAILGLAYPILLTAVTRLDEKYKSATIVRLFRRRWEFQAFQILLISVLVCVTIQIIWIIHFKPFPAEKPKFYFYDWSEIILSSVCGLLIIAFFFFIHRIVEFYDPGSLVSTLRRSKSVDHELNFKALTVLLFFGIQINDDELVATLRAHFGQLFIDVRNKAGAEPVKYPGGYYEMVYDTIFFSDKTDYWKVRNVGFAAASGRWLIGSREYNKIDELTYAWLWNNLKLMLRLDREDLIEEFWQNSHQFITTGLAPLPWEYNTDHSLPRLNQAKVDQRERERDQFFEFHTALGGMLLYEMRYDLLKRLFNHTTSIPVRYELLPITINAVLGLFFRFWTNDGLFYIRRFEFPGQDGIQGEFVSKEYIARYTALLFIRQYFLISQWYGYEPLSPPDVPSSQDQRRNWIQNLPYFKRFVEEIQQESALLKALNFEPITEEWSAARQKTMPNSILDSLSERLKATYAAEEVQQQAEEEKKTAFRDSSAQIIDARVASYKNVLNDQSITGDFSSTVIKGGYILYEKAAFAGDQGVFYMNYDTFFANEIAAGFTRQFTGVFRSKAVQSFLFRAPQLFEAIDKMRLIPDRHVLVNFGIAIDVVMLQHGIDRLTKDSYKGIPILTVQYVDRAAMRSSLMVMLKADLPSLVFKTPDQSEIERFHLIRVSASTQLFAAVNDLNEEPQLKTLFPNEKAQVLNTSVILSLELNIEVRWKKDAKLIHLVLYSDFYQQGTPNDVSEVTRF